MCAFGRFPPEVINVNLISGSGECGVHIAAGLGRLEMLKVRETYICIIRVIIIIVVVVFTPCYIQFLLGLEEAEKSADAENSEILR